MLVADLPSWLVSSLAFLFGAVWGSFFNVAIYRWPLGMSVVTPASHCPACDARIPPWLNVPIFGYLLLRGRTACCKTPLSPRYPVVELLGAVLCVAVSQRYIVAAEPTALLRDAALEALCYFIFVSGLLIATFVDLDHMEIPDEVSLPGTALGLVTATFRAAPGAADAALGAGAGFLAVQVPFVWGYERLTGRRGMGEGDSKLLMMIGAFLGWQGAAFALFAGAAQGIVAALISLLAGRGSADGRNVLGGGPKPAEQAPSADLTVRDQPTEPSETEEAEETDAEEQDTEPPPAWIGHLKLPFGPFLALGALEHLFYGDVLIDRWLELSEKLARLVGITP